MRIRCFLPGLLMAEVVLLASGNMRGFSITT